MDFALETGTAALATHRIIHRSPPLFGFLDKFAIQERRKYLWLVPYWHTLHEAYDRDTAEKWLQQNWKLPAYFHIISRKVAA